MVFALAPIYMVIPSSTAVVAHQQINSNTTSYQGTTSSFSLNALSLNKLKQETVCTNYKTPTNGVSNPLNHSSNITMLGPGVADDMHVHIVINGYVVGDTKVLDITFPDINN